ncbi:hypothetical protein FACS1894159_11270 [Bacteroidia bacterium]|nr:hypothetical protein FACS1894159_11270 [Bacteroidia bacterium]
MSKESRKVFYSMGEVAEMFDVNQSLIRFWEKKFDILKPHKNKKGNRMFTPADVENIRLIYHLSKEQGMKLDAIERRLRNNADEERSKADVLERLYAIKSILMEVRQEIKLGSGVIGDEETEETVSYRGKSPAVAETSAQNTPQAPVHAARQQTTDQTDATRKATEPSSDQSVARPEADQPAADQQPLAEKPCPRIIEQTLF